MIVSVSECKMLLGLGTDQSYDEQIRFFIPYVEDDIRNYCNNTFADPIIYRQSGTALAFVRGSTLTSSTSPDTITDADEYFSTIGFRAGAGVVIVGGSNEGFYEMDTVSSDAITLTSTGEIESQSQSVNYRDVGQIRVSQVKWPKALKIFAAKMVWYLIENPRPSDVASERIDDYAVTYVGSHAYPARVVDGLKEFRRVSLV